ncbi:pre-peptidase C-terminal domain-containing protein [Catenovulum sp. SM1970]|uniref:PKD domain-containing protein n=1 Tax=Marinifaba aquimaris TaxID=2741323 RepID=UPI001573230E|nr:PKD domain-containing protein [Marinifaba aquimaris]NTS78531.1 pre-peptidase C-terminal domain-containing protein [Marinifaba aquimaris]
MKRLSLAIMALAGVGLSTSAVAGSKYHRLVWDASPQTQATIGFTPDGGSGHYVKYGYSTDENTWQSKSVTAKHTFGGSLKSEFVKLTGLRANSDVYYRVCDSTGCDDRLWFKTAPSDNSPFIAIAGGDTRTGWTTRRSGNQLVAKIRPLFIMHGGDYTNANSASEMSSYLSDWQQTFSSDVIGSTSYKRIYPFVATHGNHEDNNYSTLCQVFGVDYDQNGACNPSDTYGAFNVSPLLRVYTLNSQFKDSGWSSYATSMNNWLRSDLASSGSSAKWRFAQYHKPMYPHYTGKSDNTILHTWWANNFYNYDMNLVVESDTHINKLTEALRPSGSGFSATTSGGTVYVGEGSWGAPARSANDPKSWTIDLASIQQFKVISVTADNLEVRTAQFSSSASTLSRSARAADSLALPTGVNWWSAASVGQVLKLNRASNGLSVIDTGGVTDPTDPPAGGALENGKAKTNLSGSRGSSTYFELDVPANASNLSFAISGGSGDADLYVKFGSKPSSSSYDCRPYRNGNSESCDITPVQAGTYHVMLQGYSSFSGLTLLGQYTAGSGNNNQAPVADFSFTTNNLAVSFKENASDDKAVTSYAWNFGDGSNSSSSNPNHTYSQAGTYSVSLTVKDAEGEQSVKTKSVSVTSGNSGGTGCSGVETWNASAVYLTDDQVAYNGVKYRARWWNQGDNPASNSGPWAVWDELGTCN